ncbi:type II toxin-antitoxin system VapC family toxin [Nocardioides endophyticus]|uniref:Ribonuclease VapC n=1 Tax=Nocardioides endophyticus TaxID=1353775 RepID=A0ABP8ZFC9_9ACTN
MTRGLLDTSVFIARESRRLDVAALPDEIAVSVVTHAELSAGVLAASDLEIRARRLTTLTAIADMNPIPIDLAVAEAWARIRVQLANARRRSNVNDMWIAATALAHGVPVVTQDHDFDVIAELSGLAVQHV